ncbi:MULTISPECIES: hypothetical protein [Rhodococcus]|uniref:hypothetical protein n=1 Tax=Rhodococcus TaxID=1827 RepID=UPI001E30357B|nr:hypothetical protein [Rhodococcus pyridinivorans]MCD2118321.1 hypothetical protein [Rhodococcus pyridinivorans]MCZ4627252.1 hypothetical protein [Rhodococcus pyridinivorans]MCZ4648444.1 hypothetical protein [Rhodococcus pyridinivorans]MDJ0481121.1 hypothetical protein [Rhodococcus pyridinivorans]MDV7254587.1 hypothetical protein [Rhodococcus pyridinivorans]
MVPESPTDALGSGAAGVRDLVVEVVRSRHGLFAEAHQVSGTRYAMGFGSQWRDLLDDTHDALTGRGFQSYKLTPAGYKLPIVNNCLVYVWRVPEGVDAISRFASSPTKKSGFTAPPPDPMLFEPGFADEGDPAADILERDELTSTMEAVGDTMPLVLVMVQSSPWQLQSITWAIAVLDDSGKVRLRGQEIIWEPASTLGEAASDVEAFDSGTPHGPTLEPQKQEGTRPDE